MFNRLFLLFYFIFGLSIQMGAIPPRFDENSTKDVLFPEACKAIGDRVCELCKDSGDADNRLKEITELFSVARGCFNSRASSYASDKRLSIFNEELLNSFNEVIDCDIIKSCSSPVCEDFDKEMRMWLNDFDPNKRNDSRWRPLFSSIQNWYTRLNRVLHSRKPVFLSAGEDRLSAKKIDAILAKGTSPLPGHSSFKNSDELMVSVSRLLGVMSKNEELDEKNRSMREQLVKDVAEVNRLLESIQKMTHVQTTQFESEQKELEEKRQQVRELEEKFAQYYVKFTKLFSSLS